jgi:anhydro-N-acetylmuramic acid kinase
MAESYRVLGIMSGSSLDGVDLALCDFSAGKHETWDYKIAAAETIAYPRNWLTKLKHAPQLSGNDLAKLHHEYGRYLGRLSKAFLAKAGSQADFVSSHGHTVFHRPESGYTVQIGEGQSLSTASGYPVICDFRTKDVTLGGQGAPLVPIGDELLFPKYTICLNLGGIANVSFKQQNTRLAYDICPANQVLNYLSLSLGKEYDPEGALARSGSVNNKLLAALNDDPYYRKSIPKSLSNEYVQQHFMPYFNKINCSPEDKLRTATEHIAQQLANAFSGQDKGSVLVTGGGAYNTFLTACLVNLTDHEVIVPGHMLIDFKEALVFAFMGVLRKRGEINCLSTATGARKDSCCGVVFYP